MKLFNPIAFSKTSITADQAEQNARIADEIVKTEGFLLYGKYKDGKYVELSEEQKPGDTIVMIGFAPKQLSFLSPHK